MKRLWCLLSGLWCLAVAGCSSLAPQGQDVAVEQLSPLRYYAWLVEVEPDIDQERARLQGNTAAESPGMVALREGLLLLVSGRDNAGDEADILARLVAAGDGLLPEDRSLALLVSRQIEARQQLRQAQRLGAEQRRELDTMRTDAARLREQIDALTSIEKQLIQRELPRKPDHQDAPDADDNR